MFCNLQTFSIYLIHNVPLPLPCQIFENNIKLILKDRVEIYLCKKGALGSFSLKFWTPQKLLFV